MAKATPLLGLGLLVGAGGGWYLSRDDGAALALAQLEIDRLGEELERRELQITYLKERERVARVDVVEQVSDPSARGNLRTTVRFQEFGEDGEPLGDPVLYTIDGDQLYVDAHVIKFEDRFVQERDLVRGSSLLVFQRLFGSYEAPADGLQLDDAGRLPHTYSAEAGGDFHAALWRDFWDYALDPEVAREAGVRAMHGEATSYKLAPGNSYELLLRTSGGLSMRVLPRSAE